MPRSLRDAIRACALHLNLRMRISVNTKIIARAIPPCRARICESTWHRLRSKSLGWLRKFLSTSADQTSLYIALYSVFCLYFKATLWCDKNFSSLLVNRNWLNTIEFWELVCSQLTRLKNFVWQCNANLMMYIISSI